MKDETIRVGDLVMVVRPAACGCYTQANGVTFIVRSIVEKRHHCSVCFTSFFTAKAATGLINERWSVSLDRLRKIHPLDEPQTITTDDEVTA